MPTFCYAAFIIGSTFCNEYSNGNDENQIKTLPLSVVDLSTQHPIVLIWDQNKEIKTEEVITEPKNTEKKQTDPLKLKSEHPSKISIQNTK